MITQLPASTPVRLGVLGCANVAWRRALPSAAEVTGLAVTAIASRDPDKATAFAERFGAEPVDGYESLLRREDIDAVYLPLPPSLHRDWVCRALHAGKHVLVEKPLATSGDEAREMAALAADSNLVLMENFAFLRHSTNVAVRTIVADGVIGDLRTFAGEFAFPPLDPADIRYSSDLGGGALHDAGVYPLRAAQSLLDADLEVAGSVLWQDPGFKVDLGGSALLLSAAGTTAQITFGFAHAYRCSYTLWGTGGRIEVPRAYTAPDTLNPVVLIERDGQVQRLTLPADQQFTRMFEEFARCVREGTAPGAVEDIVRQAELIAEVRNQANIVSNTTTV